MKITPVTLALCCAVALSACSKQSGSSAPLSAHELPLNADEQASLSQYPHHWKITKTPDDGKPYWGVRIVVATGGTAFVGDDPPYRVIYQTQAVRFDSPLDSKGNPQILLGLYRGSESITGQLIVRHSNYTSNTGIEIPRSLYAQNDGMICVSTTWKGNRVELIDFRDGRDQRTAVVCLEFLHTRPEE